MTFAFVSIGLGTMSWLGDNVLPAQKVETLGGFVVPIVGLFLYLVIVVIPIVHLSWNQFIAPTLEMRKITLREAMTLAAGISLVAMLI
jgi:hypothetical protein